MTPHQMVTEFHNAYGLPVGDRPVWVDERFPLRFKLIREEYKEFFDEIIEGNLVKAAKEAADLIYVLHGMFVEFGVDLDAVFEEVHSSNMSKLGEDGKPIYRDDGKVLKGSNYREADVDKVIYGI